MQENVEGIKERMKAKRTSKVHCFENNSPKEDKKGKYFKNLFTRTLIAIVIVLGSMIYINHSEQNLLMFKKEVFTKNMSFAKMNQWYQKTFGKILPLDDLIKEPDKTVFNEKFSFKSKDSYHDGVVFNVGESYLIPVMQSGIVVFIGEKGDYGNTVIIQGVDGIDIWYGNVKNANLTLYDYIEKGSLLGESTSENMYLVFQKDGKYLSYEDYEKQI